MNKLLDRLTDKLSKVLTPISEKMMSIQWIQALSETMQAIMPVVLVGSFACLIAFLDVGPWQSIVTSIPHLVEICSKVQLITLGLFSLYVVCILTYMMGKKLELKETIACIPISIVAFLIITPCSWDGIPVTWLGTSGLFSAILVGIFVPKILNFLINKGVAIHMPSGVPKFVEDSFTILVPAIIIVAIFGLTDALIEATEFGSLHNIIYAILQQPISKIGLSLFGHMFICILAASVMFCGLHAGTIGNLLTPLLTAASVENLTAYTAGNEMPNIITQDFFNMTLPGMAGCLLIPAILCVFYCKSKQLKSVGKVAIIPAIFGIGEPVLFGLPIMLNPLLYLPMILSIIVNHLLVYGAIYSGIVGRFIGNVLPWTTPPVLYPLLDSSTPIPAALLNIIVIIIDIMIWIPFMKIMDKNTLEKEANALAEQ